LESRGSRQCCSSASLPSRTLAYATSAPPQHTDSALYPVIGQMERAAGLAYDDTPQAKLDKLGQQYAQLSLPNDGRYPALDLEPEQRRRKTLEGSAR